MYNVFLLLLFLLLCASFATAISFQTRTFTARVHTNRILFSLLFFSLQAVVVVGGVLSHSRLLLISALLSILTCIVCVYVKYVNIFRLLRIIHFANTLRSFIFYQPIVQTDLTLCMHKSLKYVFIVCEILLVFFFSSFVVFFLFYYYVCSVYFIVRSVGWLFRARRGRKNCKISS